MDPHPGSTTIIDNRGENTLLAGLQRMGAGGNEIAIAAAFFSLDGLLLLADVLASCDRIRILFGDDASPRQRRLLLEKLRTASDADLLAQRENQPLLTALAKVEALFEAGKVEARCYTSKKFHAKAYVIFRPDVYPSQMAVIGSGNFTRPGLLQNVELNVELTPEQTGALRLWYEDRWEEAQADVVTEDLLEEIRRQIDLYDPYYLYLKALLAWGDDRQGVSGNGTLSIYDDLDEHQRQGYWQAVRVVNRQHGVMVCDGVGLGKSFIALALMERYCQDGKRVLLLAPKNILGNSWDAYLKRYLGDYREPFGSIFSRPMTELGFNWEDLETENEDHEKLDLVRKLAERADLIVVDESHNFRTRSANRYGNLYRIIAPHNGRRKDIALLTATPINTGYVDIAAQLRLITHDDGSLGGYSIAQVTKAANELDKDRPTLGPAGQLSLDLAETPNQTLNRVLEQVLIQRSRTTCKELSSAAGRELRFPERHGPECIEYSIGGESERYRDLINVAELRFRPGVHLLQQIRKETDDKKLARLVERGAKGIKLSAFLTEQYRKVLKPDSKHYKDEVHLAGLVYANSLKQLESSPAAFQGIIQSIATGLLGRMQVVFKGDAAAVIERHEEWVRTPIFASNGADIADDGNTDLIEDGDALALSGDEPDAWLAQAIKSRGLSSKLGEFTPAVFDVDRWRRDIEEDLDYLHEVQKAIIAARWQPDPKLAVVVPRIARQLKKGRRVLVFTQSQRTAEYLEGELRARLDGAYNVARIDSRIENTRASIIHAFCPGYNSPPEKWSPSVPERVDVLISTDVLSEGVNLQETGAIMNYDIHWNPVRLIQRIGRVDRRLDATITPHAHSFIIYNVLPPPEIENIIGLVGTVENRTLKISKALGIDEAFFKDTDPAGNLKEFNRLYEGNPTKADRAATAYTSVVAMPDAEVQRVLKAIPPGAFGVWGDAPRDGLFALFTMEASTDTDEGTLTRFAPVIGRPVLALSDMAGGVELDAPAILSILAGTTPGDHSANPSGESELATRLKQIKVRVRQSFAQANLPNTIRPKLVCWMELRKGKS